MEASLALLTTRVWSLGGTGIGKIYVEADRYGKVRRELWESRGIYEKVM